MRPAVAWIEPMWPTPNHRGSRVAVTVLDDPPAAPRLIAYRITATPGASTIDVLVLYGSGVTSLYNGNPAARIDHLMAWSNQTSVVYPGYFVHTSLCLKWQSFKKILPGQSLATRSSVASGEKTLRCEAVSAASRSRKCSTASRSRDA